MSQILQDLLCGALGYHLGRKNISQSDVETIIDAYLAAATPSDIVAAYAAKHNVYGPDYSFFNSMNEAIKPYQASLQPADDPYAEYRKLSIF